MANPNGNPANLTGGSRKGVPNKASSTMKAAIQSVYDALQAGSGKPHGHFQAWAEEQPTEFYKLASKLIPVQLTGEDGGPIKHEIATKEQRDAAVRAASDADR